jgi:hypothetical protein
VNVTSKEHGMTSIIKANRNESFMFIAKDLIRGASIRIILLCAKMRICAERALDQLTYNR